MDKTTETPNGAAAYELALLALCVWRESRGEVVDAKYGVAWTIRNRVMHPTWWGKDWAGCILRPWQFSSFNPKDPNAVKWPDTRDTAWLASLQVAQDVYAGSGDDPTHGATHYFDKSLDDKPPEWSTDGSMFQTITIGNLRFWKVLAKGT